MKYPISLDNSSEYGSPTPALSESSRKHYPTLNLHWKERYDLPEDGTMVVKFHKCREVNTKSDTGDSQSVELEILSIESVKADKSEAPKKSQRKEAEEALDAAMEESTEEEY